MAAFDFSFTSLQDMRQLRGLIDFIHLQDLGYPNYHDWVAKAESELLSGYKGAIVAYSDGKVVGNLIFQPHKGVSSLLEIKNLRVHQGLRDRNFGMFMLRQLEVEAAGNFDAIIGDIRHEQKQVIAFSASCGFAPIATVPLYGDNQKDVVIVKFLRGKENQLIQPLTRKIERNVCK
jgi:ribosomal protein S18 acetylase RimI-like enzyme